MKTILKAAAFCSAFMSLMANATVFDFSYTFDDSSTITGSLSGTLNGSYVENVSNVQAFFNGVKFSGSPLFSAAWNTTTQDWDNSMNALVSTNASLNNFIFADANVPADYNVRNYFYFVNDLVSLGQQAFANNLNTGDIALDSPTNKSWSLVARAPEPSSSMLLMLGFASILVVRQKRKHA